ncbi:MAG TPA: hypothetical protein VF553_20720 [Pyrinomonadaceae bacterium]|jgi:hypothetical protein
MSVIGSLDEQVDAVLISPLEKQRRSRETETAARDERSNPKAPSTSQTPTRAPGTEKSSGHTSPDGDELPVWLL